MNISEFDYELPEELIAQDPLEKRDISRMLVAERAARSLTDAHFYDLPKHLRPGDLLVLNNTKVFPARLVGESETGARIELFLVEELEGELVWETLAKPARRLKPGKRIFFGGGELTAEVLEKRRDGRVFVRFECADDFEEVLERVGQTPLPPYIKREEGGPDGRDRRRYQTVYARSRGAIAAPTAGLHFTPEILEQVRAGGVGVAEITLHVGYGTFEPVRVEDLSGHTVMAEKFFIEEPVAETLNRAKQEGRRIIAVGTTTTRALETTVQKNEGRFAAGPQLADLTITPGYGFRAIDGLLTNFHLPRSSLLVLVSTFGGFEFIMEAYARAVRERYRFYSYGDCMLVV